MSGRCNGEATAGKRCRTAGRLLRTSAHGTASRQHPRKTPMLRPSARRRHDPEREQREHQWRPLRRSSRRSSNRVLHLEPACDQLTRGLREQDLAAVSGRADPGRPCTSRPRYPPPSTPGSPVCRPIRTRSVIPSGHPCSASSRWPQPPPPPRPSPAERPQELVGAALDLVATRLRHRLAQQTPVLFPNSTEVLPEPMHKRRRPFDIREEQRHRTGRQPSHPNARVGTVQATGIEGVERSRVAARRAPRVPPRRWIRNR